MSQVHDGERSLNLRIHADLKARLIALAQRDRCHVSSLVRRLLAEGADRLHREHLRYEHRHGR
jgi:hypothetical protein